MSFARLFRHLIIGLSAAFVNYQTTSVAFANQRAGITFESNTKAWGEKEHETNPLYDHTNDKDNQTNGWCNAEHITAVENPCNNTKTTKRFGMSSKNISGIQGL